MTTILASRTFSAADQEAFARLSGDRNPMHVDALAARRTLAGAPVVHGIHGLLWALDALADRGWLAREPASAIVRFTKFLHLDRRIDLRVLAHDATSVRAELADGALSLVSMHLTFDADGSEAALGHDLSDLPAIAPLPSPLEPTLEAMAGAAGWLAPPVSPDETARCFPHLARRIGVARVEAVTQLSTLVGMVCPGLHSVFSGLKLKAMRAGASDRPGIGFRAVRADPRYRLVTLSVAGSGLTGEVVAFARPEPAATPAMEALRQRVEPGEFAGRTALVVGGSRGLGALSAKLLAAGGARVVVTYARGRDDAHALRDEINADREAHPCSALRFDVREGAAALASLDGPVTDLLYFATPPIFRQTATVYDATAFAAFLQVYVEAFHEVCATLLARDGGASLSAFYPSSVAVAERPPGLTEYAMAKAAGEILCADLVRGHPTLRILTARLPRLPTDQTATLAMVECEDPVAVMLPLIRATAGPG